MKKHKLRKPDSLKSNRIFISRSECAVRFGIYSLKDIKLPNDLKLAISIDGIVYEAKLGEIHSQIIRRENICSNITEGFTYSVKDV